MSYNAKLSETKSTASGMNGIDERVQYAHNSVNQILENLSQLEARLYGPSPQPVDGPIASTPASHEHALNALNNRLREVETLTQRLLHG